MSTRKFARLGVTALISFTAVFLSALTLSSCGKPVEENNSDGSVAETPYPRFQSSDSGGEKNFAKLINSYPVGRIDPTPWAGYWWPYTDNGIATGKYGEGKSPAGKYDAARGGQTRAQSWEAQYHGSGVKNVQQWWGHCNGWCAAAALFPEPKENVKVNGVEFTVADQKALLAEAGMTASADYYGNRVDWANDYNTPKYHDTVPDQYFLVLTNYIGRLKQAVLIDRYTGDQVWNQPLAGYKMEYPKVTDYLGADPQNPSVYRILVESTIWWAEDSVPPNIRTPEFNFQTDSNIFTARTLKMEVWLDAPVVFGSDGKIESSGNVIVTRQGDYFVGGAWRMGEGIFNDAWPDYMWVPYSFVKPDPADDYSNPHVDIDWLKKHILVPGGADDPSARPLPIDPAPNPSARPSTRPSSSPSVTPSPRPSNLPWPFPTRSVTPQPTATASSAPVPAPPVPPLPPPPNHPQPGPMPVPRPTRNI